MRAYIKVRQRAIPRASTAPIFQETFPGKKSGLPRKWFALIYILWQGGIQRFNGQVSNRNLCIDDWVDDETGVLGALS